MVFFFYKVHEIPTLLFFLLLFSCRHRYVLHIRISIRGPIAALSISHMHSDPIVPLASSHDSRSNVNTKDRESVLTNQHLFCPTFPKLSKQI